MKHPSFLASLSVAAQRCTVVGAFFSNLLASCTGDLWYAYCWPSAASFFTFLDLARVFVDPLNLRLVLKNYTL